MRHEIGYWFFIRYSIFCAEAQIMVIDDTFFLTSTYIH